MPDWLSIFEAAGLIVVLVILLGCVRTMCSTSVTAVYAGGVEFVGGKKPGGRTLYRSVQWVLDPDDPRPCPFVLHLPGGDLGGNALGDWTATAKSAELGSPDELEVWPSHDEAGRLVCVSIRMVPPSRLFGARPIELSINGTRVMLPLTDDDLVRLLGEPTERRRLR